jgi:hypothetical protein
LNDKSVSSPLLEKREQGFVGSVLTWGRIAWEFEIDDEAVMN